MKSEKFAKLKKLEQDLVDAYIKNKCAETYNAILDFWREKRMQLVSELPRK